MMLGRAALRGAIARVGRWLVLSFLLVSLALPYWAVMRGPDLLARPENVRPLEEEARTVRGRILDASGVELARSDIGSDGYTKRVYSVPSLSHVVGYWSLRYGASGVEAARNDLLRGTSGLPLRQQLENSLLHRPAVGHDVVLTIDARLQRVTDDALGKERGAAIVLDVRSGAVLALASHPYFDANSLESDIQQLKADPDRPLFNRATQGLYPPGSTFKTVTLAAALEAGVVSPSSVFTYTLNAPDAQHHGWWHVSPVGIPCENHPTNNSPFNLAGAYAWSCNAAFGDIGLSLGPQAMRAAALRFGIGKVIPFELPTTPSQLFVRADYFSGDERFYALAATAFGQGQLAVTPLQMALVAAAVANDGRMPQPYLVARVQTTDGRTLEVAHPRLLSTAMSPQTASIVRDMMVLSVDQGWARTAAIQGVTVGGKTGTAETAADETPHSWFIGFIPGNQPRFAVAVILERAGYGSAQAAPAAKRIMEAILQLR